jgi:hypothetical protein
MVESEDRLTERTEEETRSDVGEDFAAVHGAVSLRSPVETGRVGRNGLIDLVPVLEDKNPAVREAGVDSGFWRSSIAYWWTCEPRKEIANVS